MFLLGICASFARAYNYSMPTRTTLKEIGDMLTHVVKHMATKEDLKWRGSKVRGAACPGTNPRSCAFLLARNMAPRRV